MKLNERNFGLPIFALTAGAFLFVGAQRLGSVPVPDSGDEAMILQVPYEILNRGLFAWPMYRYLGGNIANVWHSFRPVYYLLMTGFFKIFGWGLLQGRAFNLIAAAAVLVMVFLIGRRLFDWRVALIAVVMLVSDNAFVERSRMVRNEYLAVMFALLAFYVFETAERRKKVWLYVASGALAGAGVMTHTNIVYILGAILLLLLLRHGWRVVLKPWLFQFAAGAFAMMAYEIVYDIIDFANLRLQYRGDRAHFARASSSGLFQNLLDEPARYRDWISGSLLFPDVPRTLQHLFQALTVAAIAYLIVVAWRSFKRGAAIDDSRVRVLLVTLTAMIFLAIATGRRRKYAIYMAYLTPWFALCAGILLRDALETLSRFRARRHSSATLRNKAAFAAPALAFVLCGALLARQDLAVARAVTDPHLASFVEFSAALRTIVPEGVCPASIERPVIWLAFPESDRCYASIERRMADRVDIDGRDFALVIPTKKNPAYIKDPDENYTLLGTMESTPYGNLRVYYTGSDERYRLIAPRHYEFFDGWRGHVSREQIADATEVWTANASELSAGRQSSEVVLRPEGLTFTPPRSNKSGERRVDLCSVELKSDTAYHLIVEAASPEPGWQLTVVDAASSQSLKQAAVPDQQGPQRIETIFRTFLGNRVRVAANVAKHGSAATLSVNRISVREIAGLSARERSSVNSNLARLVKLD
jgi:4-amino-4-deoxy-L-arabinose transferase-like glycosyltransferase